MLKNANIKNISSPSWGNLSAHKQQKKNNFEILGPKHNINWRKIFHQKKHNLKNKGMHEIDVCQFNYVIVRG